MLATMTAVMGSSSEELRHEHRVILGVLAALEAQLAAARTTGTLPAEFLHQILEFTQQFVDRCHHGKEEGCLFPCLQHQGMPSGAGLLAVLLEEHATGRDLVRRISAALDRCERGEAPPGDVLDPALAYVDLLRQHIAKEDDVLFPMSDGFMAPADHSATARCYDDREAALGPGEHHRLEHLAHRLMEGHR